MVSGGFHEVVDRLAADAHLDFWIANRLEAADGCLTGHVLGDIVTKDVKLQSLRDWASRMGISMGQTVAVADDSCRRAWRGVLRQACGSGGCSASCERT